MATATRTVKVASTSGLHARPAALFVQAAKTSGHKVTVQKGDSAPANAASVLGVMALGAKFGDEIVLTAEGDNPEEALAKIAEVVETNQDAA